MKHFKINLYTSDGSLLKFSHTSIDQAMTLADVENSHKNRTDFMVQITEVSRAEYEKIWNNQVDEMSKK